MRQALLAAALLVGLANPAAAAEPRRVAHSEAVGNPALAGADVVYAGVNRKRVVEVRRVAPSGHSRVVAKLASRTPGQEYEIAVAGSADYTVAAHALFHGLFGSGAFAALAVPGGSLPTLCPDRDENLVDYATEPPVAVVGDLVATIVETCSGGRVRTREVVVRNMRDGTTVAQLPTSGRSVRMAGHYVAYLDPFNRSALHVYDLDRHAVAYGVPLDGPFGFTLASDGTAFWVGDAFSACTGYLAWASEADPHAHYVDDCEASLPIAAAPGRVAYVHGSSIAVTTLRKKRVATVRSRADITGLDFDGSHIAFATEGCSPDTGGVWLDDITRRNGEPPRAPKCRAVITSRSLRIDRRNRVTVRLRCPTGCRGSVDVEPVSGRGFFAHRTFELSRGRSSALRMSVIRPRSGFHGKRTAKAHIVVSLEGIIRDTIRTVPIRR